MKYRLVLKSVLAATAISLLSSLPCIAGQSHNDIKPITSDELRSLANESHAPGRYMHVLLDGRGATWKQPEALAGVAVERSNIALSREYLDVGVLVYLWKGNSTKALERIKEALALNPSSYMAKLWLGEAYSAAGQPSAACECFQAVLEDKQNPESIRLDPISWLEFADALESCGRQDEAVVAYKEAASLRTGELPVGYVDKVTEANVDEATNALMGILMLDYNKPCAQTYLLKAQQVNPSDPLVTRGLKELSPAK